MQISIRKVDVGGQPHPIQIEAGVQRLQLSVLEELRRSHRQPPFAKGLAHGAVDLELRVQLPTAEGQVTPHGGQPAEVEVLETEFTGEGLIATELGIANGQTLIPSEGIEEPIMPLLPRREHDFAGVSAVNREVLRAEQFGLREEFTVGDGQFKGAQHISLQGLECAADILRRVDPARTGEVYNRFYFNTVNIHPTGSRIVIGLEPNIAQG